MLHILFYPLKWLIYGFNEFTSFLFDNTVFDFIADGVSSFTFLFNDAISYMLLWNSIFPVRTLVILMSIIFVLEVGFLFWKIVGGAWYFFNPFK